MMVTKEPTHSKNRKKPKFVFGFRYHSLKIALIYFVIGCLWILFSDNIAEAFFHDRTSLVLANIIKGWFYVTVTSVLLFALISRTIKMLSLANDNYEKANTLFSAILESSPDIIVFSLDTNYCYTSFNNTHKTTIANITGKVVALGVDILSIFENEEDRQKAQASFNRALAGESFSLEEAYDAERRLHVYWKNYYAPIRSRSGAIIGLTCFVLNVTDLKNAERERQYFFKEHQHKHTLLKALINSIPDLIFYKDCNSVYKGCNSAFERFAGHTENDLIGLTDFELFKQDQAQLFRAMDVEMMKNAVPRRNEEMVTYPDGTMVYLETLKTPYFDKDNNLLGLIGVSRDITERKKKEEEILALTYHDVLTGLYNRTFFTGELKRLDTSGQLPLSVITGDINGLKLVNDAFGHAEGDRQIVEIAKILKTCVREKDVLARIGGDEFCILLPKTDTQEVQIIVDRIREACAQFINVSNKDKNYVSIALGHATKESDNETFEMVFRTAEEYMYRRKMLEYKSQHSSIISSIKSTMFEKSNETEAHAERLAELSKHIGYALGLEEKEIVELELLSTLHDIGKISVDVSILTKCGTLTDEEWQEIKKHPEVGYRITQNIPELKHISEYILCHHERWDGKGYPQGLKGEEIPLLSRILTIADSYDAMTQDRVYRKALSREDAIAELKKNAGTQFDPRISQIFIDYVLEQTN